MISLTETNVHWKRAHVVSSFERTLKKTWPNDKISTCTSESELNWNTDYKPGLTTTISLNKLSSSIVHKGQDPSGLGRWNFTTILGKQNRRTTIFTTYRLCKSPIESV